MTRPNFKSLTSRILVMKFASEFILIYPLYTIMYSERGGVTAAGIGTIIAIGSVASVLFEIPTGIVADKMPRKYVLVTAILSKITGLAMWLVFPSFLGFLVGTLFFSLCLALESGALQAYLYGTLGGEAKQSFGKFWARISSMLMIAWASSFVVTAAIGVRYSLLIVLSILACLIALGLCLALPLDSLVLASTSLKPKIFKSALVHIKNTPSLVRLLVESLVILAMAEVLIEYISLYYYQVGVNARYVPLLLAAGNVIGAITFWYLHKWENFINKFKAILTLITVGLFIIMFRGGVVAAAIGFLLIARFYRVIQVQFESNMQNLANEQTRATVTSLAAFSTKLLAAVIMVMVGLTAVNNSIVQPLRMTLLISSAVFITVHLLLKIKQPKVGV